MHKPIVVVGSINMDLVARCREIPAPGQSLIGTGFDTTPGGKGANQAVAAARLGYPVQMVGAVGDDVFGSALLDNLSAAGVGTAAVKRVDGPSGVATILVAENGENSIVVVPGANGKVDPAYIDSQAELICSAGMVLCQLELPIPTVRRVLDLCAGCRRSGDARPRSSLSGSGRDLAAGGVVYSQRDRGGLLSWHANRSRWTLRSS